MREHPMNEYFEPRTKKVEGITQQTLQAFAQKAGIGDDVTSKNWCVVSPDALQVFAALVAQKAVSEYAANKTPEQRVKNEINAIIDYAVHQAEFVYFENAGVSEALKLASEKIKHGISKIVL